MKKKLLGELIEDEVRKQQIPITKFADMICCGRNNVYKIFDRSSIHVDQLALISRVLDRNFFLELAKDPSLVDIDSPEVIQEIENRRAVSQFMEVVPNVLLKLGKQPIISFGKPLELREETDLPDFMLTDYLITFTIGGFICERPQIVSNPCFKMEAFESHDGIKVYSMINIVQNTRIIDIKLDYKSEEKWEKTLRFVFETFFS